MILLYSWDSNKNPLGSALIQIWTWSQPMREDVTSSLIDWDFAKPLVENGPRCNPPLIARFMGPTWGPSGADRTQVGPMLAPWNLLSGYFGLEGYLSTKCPLIGLNLSVVSRHLVWSRWNDPLYAKNDKVPFTENLMWSMSPATWTKFVFVGGLIHCLSCFIYLYHISRWEWNNSNIHYAGK